MKTYSDITLTAAPFVYTRLPASKINICILSLLGIQILILALSADLYALLNIIFSVLGVIFIENLIRYLNGSKLSLSLETIISGVLIGFFMPTEIGFIFVFALSAF